MSNFKSNDKPRGTINEPVTSASKELDAVIDRGELWSNWRLAPGVSRTIYPSGRVVQWLGSRPGVKEIAKYGKA